MFMVFEGGKRVKFRVRLVGLRGRALHRKRGISMQRRAFLLFALFCTVALLYSVTAQDVADDAISKQQAQMEKLVQLDELGG